MKQANYLYIDIVVNKLLTNIKKMYQNIIKNNNNVQGIIINW